MSTDHTLVKQYLARLDAELAHVPADERAQIVDGIDEHVATALAELDEPTEADVRAVLARLGEPEAIAADASEHTVAAPAPAPSDRLTTVLLWVGAVIGIFDLLMVSTSAVGPIEFAFLAVPVVALVLVSVHIRRRDSAAPVPN